MDKPEKIPYRLKKRKRKTLSIYVNGDGEVEVLAPEHLSEAEIDQLVASRAYAIYKHQARFELLRQSEKDREYVAGETFLYLGRNYRLTLEENRTAIELIDGRFYAPKVAQEEYPRLFIEFYKQKAKEKLIPRVRKYAKLMSLTYRKVRILDLKTRWASCNEKGDVNFHWKCMLGPMKILDYIVVHELAHLVHPTHTDAFWGMVDRVLPDYLERKEWLKLNGAGMDV